MIIREACKADFPRIVELANDAEPGSLTLPMLLGDCRDPAAKSFCRRTVAESPAGGILGYGYVTRQRWHPAGEHEVWVTVDKRHRGQGIGSALYRDIEGCLKEQGAAGLRSEVMDNCELSMRFATRRGFQIDRHMFASTLDVGTLDETPYASVLKGLGEAGVRFLSLADFSDSQDARMSLYEVNCATTLDMPGHHGTLPAFPEFERELCGAAWYDPEGILVALDGSYWVGLGTVKLRPETGESENLMTGVLASHRGRGIGLALKLHAIRYARRNGAKTMTTFNDSTNVPMLAINRRLGYVPQPGPYLMKSTFLS